MRIGEAIRPSSCDALGQAIIGFSGYPPRYLGWSQYRGLGAAALDLCAAAVAYKLARRLWEVAPNAPAMDVLEQDLDLVALATVADVVTLLGENRTLVRRGLLALSATAKPDPTAPQASTTTTADKTSCRNPIGRPPIWFLCRLYFTQPA